MRKWSEVRHELYTEDEIRESDLRVAIICELVKARNDNKLTQAEFERLSGDEVSAWLQQTMLKE